MSYTSMTGIARTGLGLILAGVLVLLGPTSQASSALPESAEDPPAQQQDQKAERPQKASQDRQAADSGSSNGASEEKPAAAEAKAGDEKKQETIRISRPDGTVVVKSKGSPWPGRAAAAPKAIRVTGSSSTGPVNNGAVNNRAPTGANRLHRAGAPVVKPALVGTAEAPSGSSRTGTARVSRSGTLGSGMARVSSPTLGTVEVPGDSLLLTGRGSSGRNGGRNLGGGAVAGDEADTWLVGRGWGPFDDDDGGDDGDYLSSLFQDEFVVLEPGDGWDGPTEQPPAVGNEGDPGYDAKAIARWDVVPYQTITEDFHIGVVAFHINGIDRVEFSVNGGPWVAVREMQLNPRTNVWEYTAVLKPELFPGDGLVEVRALVWPFTAGQPRVLAGELTPEMLTRGGHSMLVNIDQGGDNSSEVRYVSPRGSDATGTGSLGNPFATIMRAAGSIADAQNGHADGGVILLLAGSHQLGTYSSDDAAPTISDWLTIAPAPHLETHEVALIGTSDSNGLRTKLLRLSGLRIAADGSSTVLQTAKSLVGHLWLDGCDLVGPNRAANFSWCYGFSGVYATHTSISNCRDGLKSASILRQVDISNIGSDAFSGSLLVIDCTVTGIDKEGTAFHPDVYQLYGPDTLFDNIILYHVRAFDSKSQGIFIRGVAGVSNMALVNVLIDNEEPIFKSQMRSPTLQHFLLYQSTFSQSGLWWRLDETYFSGPPVLKNVDIQGNCFESVLAEYDVEPIHFDHNHFIDSPIAPGDDVSRGNPRFRNEDANDFTPDESSVLIGRIATPRTPTPSGSGMLVIPAAIGSVQPEPPR